MFTLHVLENRENYQYAGNFYASYATARIHTHACIHIHNTHTHTTHTHVHTHIHIINYPPSVKLGRPV